VLFAQLVDDPSSHPDRFPSEDDQRAERERLHGIIEQLVVWENTRNEDLLKAARDEILASTGGELPTVFDPFAGGGSIPLEAQRLGLPARASDLNPLAVLINKALIELPPRVSGRPPVFPGLASSETTPWVGTRGLAADVRAYGESLRSALERELSPMYPREAGSDVIAWIWARTIPCPNPACGIAMPLTSTWKLGRKPGREMLVEPEVVFDNSGASRFDFKLVTGARAKAADNSGTAGRSGAQCASCGTAVPLAHIRAEGVAGRLGASLMATVVKDGRGRRYVAPSDLAESAANVERPDLDLGQLPEQAIGFSVQGYGLREFADMFTPRQLKYLDRLTTAVRSVAPVVEKDGLAAGLSPAEAEEYAGALTVYLGLAASRTVDLCNAHTSWSSSRDETRNLFNMQTVQMGWEFVEINPFAGAAGDAGLAFQTIAKALDGLPSQGTGSASQGTAQDSIVEGGVLSTDPPYYDYVGYSDLSDVFYGWLRRCVSRVQPSLFSTMLVPKLDELVANQFRHGGKKQAREFFEEGFRDFFTKARVHGAADVPATLYFAFKQADAGGAGGESAWEAILESVIRSGWLISATWPIRSERAGRMRDIGSNALASSIVLALRPRPEAASTTDRRGFIASLEAELPSALRHLQEGQIAPVDLPQAAVGPGMAVFSRFSAVLEPDGSKMTVRSALARINEILDQVLNEQEGDFDAASRFSIAWYRQHGYGIGKFGDADNLARARNTSVDVMERDGVLTSRAGSVKLIKPAELRWDYDPVADTHTSNWEALHHLIKVMEREGIQPAGQFLQAALGRPDGAVDGDLVKELAHLLFRVAESNGWTRDALSFNSLVASWPEILEVARSAKRPAATQGAFDFDEDE